MRTILIACSGMSPAIITETAWALAHEPEPVTPAEVVAITTEKGRTAIRTQLFQSGTWQQLKKELKAPAGTLEFADRDSNIRLLPSDAGNADDLLTSEDNARAADFILQTLRSYTEDPETQIIFSIAGGRKTMGALGALCMTLLGRDQDRLCHVLVPPPFDGATTPVFFFPMPKAKFKDRDGKSHGNPEITLCDIPFVRTRKLFQETFDKLPTRYTAMVAQANQSIRSSTPPTLRIDPGVATDDGALVAFVDGDILELTFREYILLWMLMCRKRGKSTPAVLDTPGLDHQFNEFLAKLTSREFEPLSLPSHEQEGKQARREKPEDRITRTNRVYSDLRKKLAQRLGGPRTDEILVNKKGRHGLLVDAGNIAIGQEMKANRKK